MANYYWTQKAEDDFRARHPKVKEKDVLRRAGEIATYDGKELKTGEIQRAFRMRGWITSKEASTKRGRPRKSATEKGTGDEKLWTELHSLYKKGYNIANAAILIGMPTAKVSVFVHKNQKKMAAKLGEIDFDKNKSNYHYIPASVIHRKAG